MINLKIMLKIHGLCLIFEHSCPFSVGRCYQHVIKYHEINEKKNNSLLSVNKICSTKEEKTERFQLFLPESSLGHI